MNFKPTLWKSIVSVVLIIIVDFILAYFTMCLVELGYTCPLWYIFTLELKNIIVSITCGILIYLIWSLIEKKK